MDQVVAEELPVGLRRQAELVPGAPFQAGATTSERHQPELSSDRAEVAIKVGGRDAGKRGQLAQGPGRFGDVEGQAPAGLPMGYRLDEGTRGEHAVAHRARPRAFDPGVARVGHT
jgi:hypothetical protein